MMCQCCNKKEAVRYDYREIDTITNKICSCEDCISLNNKDWLKKKEIADKEIKEAKKWQLMN